MSMRQFLSQALVAGCLSAVGGAEAMAAEYALSSYALGGSAFGAGVTPPAGTYPSHSGRQLLGRDRHFRQFFGGVTLNAGAKLDFFSSGLNVLYMPERKLFGGDLGLSVKFR